MSSPETLKSNSVTALDASPPTRSTSGAFAFGRRVEVRDYVQPTTGPTQGSKYILARIPSNARDVQVILESHGTITTLTGDVGLYYSDLTSENVGRAVGLGGTVIDVDFFATAVTNSTTDTPVDVTVEAGTYHVGLRNKEIWDAVGLSADPQVPLDVVLTTTATNSLTNSGCYLAARVSYIPAFLS